MLMICAIFLPIVAGALLPRLRFESRRARSIYVEAFVILTSILAAAVILGGGERIRLISLTDTLSIEFQLDGLGRVFTGIVAFLWPLASLYAFEYMEHEDGENTFFSFYTMTYGVTLGISMAANYETLYVFYELLTLVTLPLVCHSADSKSMAAGRKYLYYSLTGAALAFIGLMFIEVYGTTSDFVLGGVLGAAAGRETLLRVVFVLAFLGFGVKAAVFPFHGWLPAASVAPTPVTALLHAVAVVKAGVFAIMRVSYYSFGPALLRGTFAQYVPLSLAVITIVFGSAMAVKEYHIKRRLAYSTISNLSYIVFGAMLLTPAGLSASLAHMVFHALMKIILFFCAGAIMVKAEKHYVQEIRGFSRVMPFTFAVFTVAALSLIGIPPLAGFISKWNLALAAFAQGNVLAIAGVCALLVSAVLTAIYTMGVILPAYTLPLNAEDAALGKRDPGLRMKLPLALLVIALIAVSLYAQPLVDFLTALPGGLM